MTAITVRQFPDRIEQRLHRRAAATGRSMEAEARSILMPHSIPITRSTSTGWTASSTSVTILAAWRFERSRTGRRRQPTSTARDRPRYHRADRRCRLHLWQASHG
ncbi:MAG: FitA-like ribbon-helix-helix domain-containing protein [Phycicoccus sp.]